MSSVAQLILTKPGFLHSQEEGNSQGSLNLVYLGQPYIAPCQSSMWEWSWIHGWPGGNTRMLRWERLKICCGAAGGPMVWRGAWDPGWFIGSTSLSLGHQSPGVVAWLSDDQCQEETKQNPKISMLRNNRSNAHYSHQCCGSTYLPPPTAAGGTEWGKVSCASSLESSPTYIAKEDTVVFWCSFNSQIHFLVWGSTL